MASLFHSWTRMCLRIPFLTISLPWSGLWTSGFQFEFSFLHIVLAIFVTKNNVMLPLFMMFPVLNRCICFFRTETIGSSCFPFLQDQDPWFCDERLQGIIFLIPFRYSLWFPIPRVCLGSLATLSATSLRFRIGL